MSSVIVKSEVQPDKDNDAVSLPMRFSERDAPALGRDEVKSTDDSKVFCFIWITLWKRWFFWGRSLKLIFPVY